MITVKYFTTGFNRMVYGFVLAKDATCILSTEEVVLENCEIAHTMIHSGAGNHEVRDGYVSKETIVDEFCDRYMTDLHKQPLQGA